MFLKNMKISKKEFKKIYFKALQDIIGTRPLNQELKDLLAIHQYKYKHYDFMSYLEKSWFRAWQVYNFLPDRENSNQIKILDIGGFFGNFSLCFQRLGYKVTLAEAYDYYSGAFDELKHFLEKEGVEILNKDFTSLMPLEEVTEKHDVVLCLAVLEHLAHSPATILNNIKNSLLAEGYLILEVPNIAYWYRRMQLLRGESVLPSIESIYKSKEPYMGHHHEYTKREIDELAKLSGFQIEKINFYNYSLGSDFSSTIIKSLILPAYLFKSCKEIILVKLKPKK